MTRNILSNYKVEGIGGTNLCPLEEQIIAAIRERGGEASDADLWYDANYAANARTVLWCQMKGLVEKTDTFVWCLTEKGKKVAESAWTLKQFLAYEALAEIRPEQRIQVLVRLQA